MSEIDLIKYYNKFSEDKRLNSRHGQVEFRVTMEYIKRYLLSINNPKVLDVGAGTGKYSYALAEFGADVTAVELVKYNIGVLKSKGDSVRAVQGDARNLKKFKNDSFDVILLFGPMYHLLNYEDKLKALNEAKRVVKPGGLIFISYLTNDYAVVLHGFVDGNIVKSVEDRKLDDDFNILPTEPDLYSYVRVDEIKRLSEDAGLAREKMVAQDGPTDYIRQTLNKMDEKTFEIYINYILKIAERSELIGASSHILDILKK